MYYLNFKLLFLNHFILMPVTSFDLFLFFLILFLILFNFIFNFSFIFIFLFVSLFNHFY